MFFLFKTKNLLFFYTIIFTQNNMSSCFPECFTCFKRCHVQPVNLQSALCCRALGTANSLHVRLFDCLRAISGNQVLHSQELPCNNYGVKWQLATQEGICPLAAPSCSAEVRGHRLFRKSPFLKRPETGGGPRQPCLLKQHREKEKKHKA